MSGPDRLIEAFSGALDLPQGHITEDLSYRSIPQWDSVAHMALVAAIEEAFDIMLDTDDILAMSSVAATRRILLRYGVTFP